MVGFIASFFLVEAICGMCMFEYFGLALVKSILRALNLVFYH